jgi:succinyl-diaminopimelate desuccinylase
MISRTSLSSALVERTLELMRIPSLTGAEDAIADHVQAVLDGIGLGKVLRHGRSVIGDFGAGRPHVVLAGHLDTVPEQGGPSPALQDDQVVGLGSSDMKSGLAVMLALAERSKKTKGRVTLVFYDGEEGALSGNGLGPLLDAHPDLAKADLALLLEPTANIVELGCQGTMHARITIRGVAAHSARPWMGRNAIHLVLPLLTRVAGLPMRNVRMGEAAYREVMNVTLIDGGRARNVLPDRCTLNVNFRFAPDRTVEEAEAYLRAFCPETAEVEIVDAAPAAPPRQDAPLVRRFLEATGGTVRGKQGWTDVAQFASRGVPAVNFGPGLPELAHRKDERVPVENLLRAYETLDAFLDRVSER